MMSSGGKNSLDRKESREEVAHGHGVSLPVKIGYLQTDLLTCPDQTAVCTRMGLH